MLVDNIKSKINFFHTPKKHGSRTYILSPHTSGNSDNKKGKKTIHSFTTKWLDIFTSPFWGKQKPPHFLSKASPSHSNSGDSLPAACTGALSRQWRAYDLRCRKNAIFISRHVPAACHWPAWGHSRADNCIQAFGQNVTVQTSPARATPRKTSLVRGRRRGRTPPPSERENRPTRSPHQVSARRREPRTAHNSPPLLGPMHTPTRASAARPPAP